MTALAALATVASAGVITQVGSRAGLGANDSVVWGASGDDGTFPATPYTVLSGGGLSVSATGPNGLAIFENGGGNGYSGNFSTGDILLTSGLASGPITIDFATAVRGVGFDISSLNFGSFTGTMQFYGAGNVLFGSASVNGTSGDTQDGSAPFLGGTSSLRDIVRVVLLMSGAGDELTINQGSLLTSDVPSGDIPEPATVALVSAALAGCLAVRRRRSVF